MGGAATGAAPPGPSSNGARALKTLGATMVPLGQVAQVKREGPPNIRTENALLAAYIYVDIRDRDIGGYVADAQKAVRDMVKFPPGYFVTWSGQFEYMERAKEKLKLVVPLTIVIIFLLLYLNFRRLSETLIVMLSVPFALVGGVWLMYLLGYNMSVAVAVGFIALLGVAAEIGVVILIYIDQALKARTAARQAAGERSTRGPARRDPRWRADARAPDHDDRGRGHRRAAADHVGQRHRVEVMRRIAAPMVGGMVSVTVLALVVIPAIYAVVKGHLLKRAAM